MRVSAWPERLSAYLEKARNQPHKYGKHDCLLFIAGAVKAVTGKDHGRGHRRKYKSATSAARYLGKLGARSPEEYLDKLFEAKPIGFAQMGDLALVDIGDQQLPGVVLGDEAVVVADIETGDSELYQGLVRVPRALWLKAWAVG